jgi:hypothetical protein
MKFNHSSPYSIYGRKPLEHYDWIADPKHLKVEGHIPNNRCYYCGNKFMGSAFTAFCNICDEPMSPPDHEYVYVVTRNDTDAKPPIKEGHWTTRRKLIMNHIRIPEDMEEKDYRKKLLELRSAEKEPIYYPDFRKANDLV